MLHLLRLFLCATCLLHVVLATSITLEDSCRERGFDPHELSCDTCSLLKEQHNSACLECCQSYKTLHGQPQRYQHAVLLYSLRGEMQDFINESLEEIHTAKGPQRLVVLEIPSEYGGLVPSTLFWMDTTPPQDGTLDAKMSFLDANAKDRVMVEGWGKDDLKDMLLTLLQDK